MTNYKLTYPKELSSLQEFNFVVVVAQFRGKLIWVRKEGADTWELPTGHVEKGETPELAARRELWEETGAIEFSLIPITDFSIQHKSKTSYNRLYFAKISKMENLPNFEIQEIILATEVPAKLTYGYVQLELMRKALGRFENSETKFD